MREDSGGNVNTVALSPSDSNSDTYEDEVSSVNEFDCDYGSIELDSPGGCSSNPTTVVHMTNSKDVEIKPTIHTQYHAPVTIHQYVNAAVSPNDLDPANPCHAFPGVSVNQLKSEKVAERSEPPIVQPDTPWKKLRHTIKSSIRWKMGIVLVVIAAVAVVVVTVSLTVGKKNRDDDYDEDMAYDFGNETYIFPRERWAGRPMRPGYETRSLEHPIGLVVIAHTASPQCMTFRDCAKRLQTIQTDHISRLEYVDIGYNFLIGGDGIIYQALGWDYRNYLRIKQASIEVAYVGNYGIDEVNDRQRHALKKLLELGVELGKLDQSYKLVGHNQVANTESPGKFLIQEIRRLPHYYGGYIT